MFVHKFGLNQLFFKQIKVIEFTDTFRNIDRSWIF